MTHIIVDIIFPAAWIDEFGAEVNNDWWIFEDELWTVEDLINNILSTVDMSGSWKLQKDASDLTNTDLCWDVLENQDILTLVEL